MITQTLKRWLNKLFAWWPWGQPNRTNYSRAANSLNRGTTQELVWRTSIDGYVPQPGITSVVVEQGGDDTTPNIHEFSTDEHSERVSQSYQPTEVSPSIIPQNNGMPEISSLSDDDTQSPSDEEQHLTFLYYLVKRGVYNEGFAEGQEPEQYRQR
ncbi:MAG: hypothetical protein H0U76_04685 [Ktedonobacteraceae bacterium]|nr:hypothetical protein [Ktedonobacteraceae bacterium]